MGKKEGDPCPRCSTPLLRRKSNFRSFLGDVAHCAGCNMSFEMFDAPADRRAIRAPQPA